jgi:predicted amidohydrolase
MRILRIAMAQINPTVGDLKGNRDKIIDYINRAKKLGADIVAFTELAVTGYPPEDLILKPQFVKDNLRTLREITRRRAVTHRRVRGFERSHLTPRQSEQRQARPRLSQMLLPNWRVR